MSDRAPLPTLDIGEMAHRVVETVPPSWLAVLVGAKPGTCAEALMREIASLGVTEVTHIVVSATNSFEVALRSSLAKIVVASVPSTFHEADWSWIDQNRTRFLRDAVTVLVLDVSTFGQLENAAPNLASLLAGNAWVLAEPVSLDAVSTKERLVALRTWAGKTDAQILQMAKDGSLPSDPPYAEWVALLGRGDLLVK